MTNPAAGPLPILSFWRDLEIFNIPAAPGAREATASSHVLTLRRGEVLPWRRREYAPSATHGWIHLVYLGVADTEQLEGLLLKAMAPRGEAAELSERERERSGGTGWLGAFVVGEDGAAKPDSYLAASYVYGVDLLRKDEALEGLSARLAGAREEFAQRRQRPPAVEGGPSGGVLGAVDTDAAVDRAPIAPTGRPAAATGAEARAAKPRGLGWVELDEELGLLLRRIGAGADDARLDWRLVVRSTRVNRKYMEADLQNAGDFLNSFYLDDLDRLIGQAQRGEPFGQALGAYLGAPLALAARRDILADQAAMTGLLSVAHLPRARWPAPAKFPLVLAQQAAVAQILRVLGPAGGVVGVNGPPGTGKTTLLCDVIADVVTQRALRLMELQRPADVFADTVEVAGKNVFPLRAEIMDGSSIVVASTNNNAVKNITQELPARKKVSAEFGPASYFDEVIGAVFAAQKVQGEDGATIACWGMVAAALGNAGNRRSFAQGFFRDEFSKPEAHAANAANATNPAKAATGGANGQLFDTPATPAAQSTQTPPFSQSASSTLSAPATPSTRSTPSAPAAAAAESAKPAPPSMKQLLEAATADYARYQNEWQQARHALRALVEEFDAKRALLLKAEQAALGLDACRGRLAAQLAGLQEWDRQIEAAKVELAASREAMAVQRTLIDGRRALLEQLRERARPGLWDRLMAWLGRETAAMAARRSSLDEPTTALAQASEALAELARAAMSCEAVAQTKRQRREADAAEKQKTEAQFRQHQLDLQAGYQIGVRHFPDAGFWALPAEQRHRLSVGVCAALDTLRAKIFLQSMELHRLTVLANAGRFIGNLRAVSAMLTGASRGKLLPEQRPILWDILFFIVPVVSTTMASFDRLFQGMGQESLGWLLVDEAGQATPQSTAGAIWRSRRAVLIGDPLQIEPVFTVPLAVAEDLRRRRGVAAIWSPAEQSVQTLADRVTAFGSWVAQDDGPGLEPRRIWTGMPLRTHRRCDEPMFSVANRIAYGGQMVQGRVDPQGQGEAVDFRCVLGASAWFDVRAAKAQHPVVDEEIDVLVELLRRLQDQPAHVAGERGADGKPRAVKIYVISPFRKVKDACARRVRAAGIKGVECGTVHTFQGKEAEIVFLVLGTAAGKAGAGARAWALEKPNLLNVAITRAKCRLYMVGCAESWGRLNHMAVLYDEMARLRRVLPAGPFADNPAKR
ncbi:DEAD/DEAH box helicase [Rugamonas rubra]|uniref:AAA domain-containing protein n=1 Tax=Rugamonas rubra TaxID=758825 RepID=A0A1I4SSL3_9BURK|nr:ATP-binding protein [Rugamonas rubra]SFM67395.1 AAA domain-containing protein [Rugamonas rubra]